MNSILFSTYRLGRIDLANRVVMAPMTRSRALGNVPGAITAKYYAQRAEAGLIITEGTSPSPDGLGYARIPGIFSEEQAEGWKVVAAAVHDAGGKIFVQLMHTGRVGHPANLPAGARLFGPSALAAPGKMWTDSGGLQDHPVPVEMTEDDIGRAIDEFADAAALAVGSGLDGVELHGANGYLIDQFLNAQSNHRTDAWGGTIAGRIRFAVEAARRVTQRIGADRTGIRLSPYGVFNGMGPDEEHDALYLALAEELGGIGLAYIHLVDHSSMGAPPVKGELKAQLGLAFPGTIILSGGYDRVRAEGDLAAGRGDLVAFGRPFISNPMLVSKLRRNAELVVADSATFYTPGEAGYTDYAVEP
ncbi:MAG: alkene reductase [Deltaproteobacteria bacterium]|nr:alkene reductase [Deltaproteobacteria bacterium]